MSYIGDGIAAAMVATMWFLVALGVAIGWIAFIGLPWAWHALRPLIHQWTG